MRLKTLAAFAMTLLLVALALNVPVAAADQQSGTWKMDPAKSTYSPGPAAKSITLKIESDGDNINYSSDGIDASGNPTHVEYTARKLGFPGKSRKSGDRKCLREVGHSSSRAS